MSVNENEYNSILEAIDYNSNSNSFSKITDNEKETQENLKEFAIKTGNTVNHAKKYTAWSDGSDAAFCPTKRDQIRNLIGAGDSWDAATANIVGYLAGLEAKDRLVFSNMYCWLYMSNTKSEPGTMNEIIGLFKR
ncbi:hypothetical protein DYY65_11590 [Nitrososphaera sp. AFS]|nr:hypothetical protein [Nitrososphaera sp. AFS]